MPLICNGYYDSKYIHAKWLAEAREGEYLYNFSCLHYVSYKVWLFPPNIEVFPLKNQKANLSLVMGS